MFVVPREDFLPHLSGFRGHCSFYLFIYLWFSLRRCFSYRLHAIEW